MSTLNKNLVELIKLMADGRYHDGTSIGKHLNITRAAVWKVIQKLDQYAVPITSVKGKGYRLESPLILLDSDAIQSNLRHQSATVEVLEKVISTNDYLKKRSKDNKEIIACLAEHQTGGKGRLQRQWHSPFAKNIYLSVLCPFEKDVSELTGLSLVTGMAVCSAIESVVNLQYKRLALKWPNDILIDGCKLAGNLIEIEAESNGFCQAIIGVGVNVNMHKAIKKEIDQDWTSLYKVTHQYVDRNLLCVEIIDTLMDYLERFCLKGLSDFSKEWKKRDCLANSSVSIMRSQKKITGECLGVDQSGHLRLKTKSGEVVTFSSGDASLNI